LITRYEKDILAGVDPPVVAGRLDWASRTLRLLRHFDVEAVAISHDAVDV